MKQAFSKYFSFLLILSLCFSIGIYAQTFPYRFGCGVGLSNNCNAIPNNSFSTNCDPLNQGAPFISCVDRWTFSHGSPQINIREPYVGANINHASMWATAFNNNGVVERRGEGIAVGIPALTVGGHYEISFLKRFHSFANPDYSATTDLDNFYVVAMTCAAFGSIRTTDPANEIIPDIPATGAQIIYTGTDINNNVWQDARADFYANDAYTVLWIFPKNNTPSSIKPTKAWLEIGTPVLKNLFSCTQNPTPGISLQSHFSYGGCGNNNPYTSLISPYTTNNSDCLVWECTLSANFYSNIGNSNNQWYVNDVLINTSTSQFDISNPGHLRIWDNGIHSPNLFKIQLKNTTYGYMSLSSPTYVYFNRSLYGNITDRYKPNYTLTLFQGWSNGFSGPNSIYTWSFPSIPGFSVTDISTSTMDVQLDFGNGVPLTGINGTLTISNSNCNSVHNVVLSYDPFLRITSIGKEKTVNSITIYPNPASDKVTLNSKSKKILSIEIFDLTGMLKKRVNIANIDNVVLNVSDLKPGIYNCMVITDKGSYPQKLLIKR